MRWIIPSRVAQLRYHHGIISTPQLYWMYRAQRCEIDRRLHRQDTKRGQMGPSGNAPSAATVTRTHLQRIEDESIHIMREVVSETERPVMLYSIGKDSAVTLHLAP